MQVQLNQLQLSRPRSWGSCWLGDQLWRELQLDTFFAARLGCSREGTDWEKVLRLLTLYRLLSPGSEWWLHRHWFATTAGADLLGADERLAQDDTLYRGLDSLREHKDALFAPLRQRWSDLFGAKFNVLLYDLTSTYFECDVPEDEHDPRRFGYSREQAWPAPPALRVKRIGVKAQPCAAGLRNVPPATSPALIRGRTGRRCGLTALAAFEARNRRRFLGVLSG